MKIKLNKGLSYCCGTFKATKDKPIIDVPEDTAKYLVKKGHFSFVDIEPSIEVVEKFVAEDAEEPAPIEPGADEAPAQTADIELDKMTVTEIETFAKSVGYDFKSGLNKAQKIEALTEYLQSQQV